jgi:hypothetical protein
MTLVLLAREGVEVALVGRNSERVRAVAQEATAAGGGAPVHGHVADLMLPSQTRTGASRQLLPPRRRAHRLRQERGRDLEGAHHVGRALLPLSRAWRPLARVARVVRRDGRLEYVVDEKVLAPSAQAQEDALAQRLWERSSELVLGSTQRAA